MQHIILNPAGNVGIGTTGPNSKLGVLGNLSVGATYGSIAAPTSGVIIEGNVGIGTTSPLEKLDVAGNATVSGNLVLAGGARSITGTAMNALTLGSATTGDIQFYSSSYKVNSSGQLTLATDETINGIDINAGTISDATWNGTAIGPTYGGTGQTTYATGDILYASATNTLAKLTAGADGKVLKLSGGVPVWGDDQTGAGDSEWTLSSGTLYPNNSTLDLLVGGTATTSAKFGFLNVNSGTPVASFSGVLTLNNSSTNYINSLGGQALSFRTSVGGDTGLTDRLYIANNGNVGIGTTHPSTKLEIFDGALCVDDGISSCPTNGTPGYIYAESTSITEIDLAENYPTLDTSLEAGELVSVNPEKNESVTRSLRAYDSKLLGVISTKPGILLGGQCNDPTGCQELQVPVALAGRIPIKSQISMAQLKMVTQLLHLKFPASG
jgi:hypothetical protein